MDTLITAPFDSHGGTSPRPALRGRKLAALIVGEVLLFAVIALSFWYQDFRYSLPTPKPKNWKALPIGSSALSLPPIFQRAFIQKPVVFNFYNYDCPCSRFNLDHLKQLAQSFRSQVRFVVVIEGGTKAEEEGVFQGLGIDAEHYCDVDGTLAHNLGVYATPQGVVLDSRHRLVYRGNYNVGRYCTDSQTDFVRFALESVVSGRPLPSQMSALGPAYGCAIPAVSQSQEGSK